MTLQNKNLVEKTFEGITDCLLEVTKEKKWNKVRDENLHEFVIELTVLLKSGSFEAKQMLEILQKTFTKGVEVGFKTYGKVMPEIITSNKRFDVPKFEKMMHVFNKTKESDYEKVETFIDGINEEGAA